MPTPEIIDQATFASLLDSLGGDVDFLSELVETFLASSPEVIDSLKQAIAVGDAPTLQRAAHSLKSGSASLGALEFSAQCRELEEIGKIGVLAGAEEKSRALEAAYNEVVAALHVRLQSTRSSSA